MCLAGCVPRSRGCSRRPKVHSGMNWCWERSRWPMLVESASAPLSAEDLDAHRVAAMPVLVLDLHSRCNCRCVMCDIWKRDTSSELPFEMLTRNRDSLRALKVEWVVLTGGEPLMHSGFEKVCRFLREE